MKKRIFYFNLIEIVLCVAVISFGVVVILGMLPKGLRAAKNTATVSYVSEVIEQMGYYIQDQGTGSVTASTLDGCTAPDKKEIVDSYAKLLEGSVPNFTATGIHGVYKHGDAYVVVIGNSEEIDGERVNNVVFSGLLRVAKVDRKNYKAALTHSHADDKTVCDCDSASDKFSRQEGNSVKTVFMELSYPLSVDYDSRSKSYYSFDAE